MDDLNSNDTVAVASEPEGHSGDRYPSTFFQVDGEQTIFLPPSPVQLIFYCNYDQFMVTVTHSNSNI